VISLPGAAEERQRERPPGVSLRRVAPAARRTVADRPIGAGCSVRWC